AVWAQSFIGVERSEELLHKERLLYLHEYNKFFFVTITTRENILFGRHQGLLKGTFKDIF
ncbi:2750_t:CDS:2, partial [Gigaspora margarita]